MRAWIQRQTWSDLLFLHWPVPEAVLGRAVASPLPIDTFGGSAWLGISPLEVCQLPPRGDVIAYRTRRSSPAAALAGRYRAVGDVFRAAPGTLEHFLVERYRLATLDERRRLRYADIEHPPWPLQPAEAAVEENTMTAPWGIELRGAPLAHFAARVDVRI